MCRLSLFACFLCCSGFSSCDAPASYASVSCLQSWALEPAGFTSFGPWKQLPHARWDLSSWIKVEPVSPAWQVLNHWATRESIPSCKGEEQTKMETYPVLHGELTSTQEQSGRHLWIKARLDLLSHYDRRNQGRQDSLGSFSRCKMEAQRAAASL